MAFLDNSGDIILDAVLTDTGRKRLARGDGSFRIVKFALGDDEINYGTYDGAAPEGEKDLEILQTPILEAFTNNTSLMHSFLQTYTNNQTHLFLPVMKLNNLFPGTAYNTTFNTFLVSTDASTACALGNSASDSGGPRAGWNATQDGILSGQAPKALRTFIRVDQGIDNALVPATQGLPSSEFYENQYLIEMDSRFGQIINSTGDTLAVPSFIDDDQIASYYLSMNVNNLFVTDNTQNDPNSNALQVISGARGSTLSFQIQVSPNLQNNTSFFTRLGGIFDASATGTPVSMYYIDSVVRVTGLTTGFQMDVPVRYVKTVLTADCGL
tara:strand:+ start:1169 stop:2146 length:978 start_codon:yes stop_codon:yes gene_type:complete